MSFRLVRRSKFRHLFGTHLSREFNYENIRLPRSSLNCNYCSVNPKFIAVVIDLRNGSAFMVIPLDKTGRVSFDEPIIDGHKGPILDLAWYPFDDNIIASSSEDRTIRIWFIPDGGLSSTIKKATIKLKWHQKRVNCIRWHPFVSDLLMSAGADFLVIIWNVKLVQPLVCFSVESEIFNCSWSYEGINICLACKDKQIRIYDARNGQIKGMYLGHDGAKPQSAIYLKGGYIFTLGFSKFGDRQYSLIKDSSLGKCLVKESLDSNNSISFPYYDPDTNIIFLSDKGDRSIRYVETNEEPPYIHFLATYHSNEAFSAYSWMPKRGCDISNCEIARCFTLSVRGTINAISFTVPRMATTFQPDIFPDTMANIPALNPMEWVEGVIKQPIMMSLKNVFNSSMRNSMRQKKRYSYNFDGNTSLSNKLDETKENLTDNLLAFNVQQKISKLDKNQSIIIKDKPSYEYLVSENERLKETILKQAEKIKNLEKRINEISGGDSLSVDESIKVTPSKEPIRQPRLSLGSRLSKLFHG